MALAGGQLHMTGRPSVEAGERRSRGAEAAAVRTVLSARGSSLPDAAVRRFTPLVGHRISDVRIHDDPAAGRSADAVGARAYTVGAHIVFGSGEYATAGTGGNRLLAHELAHVAQQPHTPQAFRNGGPGGGRGLRLPEIAVASQGDVREQEARSVASGGTAHASRGRPDTGHPVLYRVSLGESISRLFGGGTFSPEELRQYLHFLDVNGRIEDEYDSDNKARAVVQRWKRGDSDFILPARRKTLLIQEMLSGFTGDDDERAILDLLAGSTDTELSTILPAVGVAALQGDLHGAERDELDRLLVTRGTATGATAPRAETAQVFPGETVLGVQERFRANAEDANRLNCILIVRELAPRLFADDPDLAARLAERLGRLRGQSLTMVEVGRVLSEVGLSSAQAKIRFGNGNGNREPTVMERSAWDTIIGMVGATQGWHVFGLAVFDGYHSVTVLVDHRPDGPRVYWADQWRIDPGDDFHQETGSESGFRRYEKAGFDAFINERTREWWNEVHSPDSKCAERARARGRDWDAFCRYPATLHIWKFRSGVDQANGPP
jgi:hypothetical protein